jgi:hypothetical protein
MSKLQYVAGNLLRYAAEHVIYGDYAYKIWDVELIKYVLDFLRPENMRIDVVSKPSFKSEGKILFPYMPKRKRTMILIHLRVLLFSDLILCCIIVGTRKCLIDGLFFSRIFLLFLNQNGP